MHPSRQERLPLMDLLLPQSVRLVREQHTRDELAIARHRHQPHKLQIRLNFLIDHRLLALALLPRAPLTLRLRREDHLATPNRERARWQPQFRVVAREPALQAVLLPRLLACCCCG